MPHVNVNSISMQQCPERIKREHNRTTARILSYNGFIRLVSDEIPKRVVSRQDDSRD